MKIWVAKCKWKNKQKQTGKKWAKIFPMVNNLPFKPFIIHFFYWRTENEITQLPIRRILLVHQAEKVKLETSSAKNVNKMHCNCVAFSKAKISFRKVGNWTAYQSTVVFHSKRLHNLVVLCWDSLQNPNVIFGDFLTNWWVHFNLWCFYSPVIV